MLSRPIRWPKPLLTVAVLGDSGHGRSTVHLAAEERARRLVPDAETYRLVGRGSHVETAHRICRFLGDFPPRRTGHHLLSCDSPNVAIVVVAADHGTTAPLVTQVRLARIRGVERFVIGVTRTDRAADPAWLDLVEADVRRVLADEGMPADEVPAVRGDFAAVVRDPSRPGCADELLAALDAVPPPALAGGPLRMFVEDVFNLNGETVVFGYVTRGSVLAGDPVEVVGLGMRPISTVVVRAEAMGKKCCPVAPEDNAGLQLAGVLPSDVARGQVVAEPGTATEVAMIEAIVAADVELDRPVRWQLHANAATAVATLRGVRELDGSPLPYGPLADQPVRSWWHLEPRLAVEPGDRFALVVDGRTAGVGLVVPFRDE